ncbi:MAG: hypothetical protein ABEJ24_03105 [Candidatus Magasanikbacteria bacterium]
MSHQPARLILIFSLSFFVYGCNTIQRDVSKEKKTEKIKQERKTCYPKRYSKCVDDFLRGVVSREKVWRCSKKIKKCFEQEEIKFVGAVDSYKDAKRLQLEIAWKILTRQYEKIKAISGSISKSESEENQVYRIKVATMACAAAGINDYWRKRFLDEKGLPKEEIDRVYKQVDKYLTDWCETMK